MDSDFIAVHLLAFCIFGSHQDNKRHFCVKEPSEATLSVHLFFSHIGKYEYNTTKILGLQVNEAKTAPWHPQ